MKILVIGSEGFIGRHIMEQGCLMGHEMTGMDNRGEPDIRGDVLLCPEQVQGFSRVILAAGVLGTQETLAAPEDAVFQNISGTLRVLGKCLKFGVPITYLTLGNTWLNPYSITKNCAAEFVRMFNVVHELPTQVAICYNLFGPYQKWKPVRKIVPEFMTRLLAGKPMELFNGGRALVDMVYAPDVARAVLADNTAGTQHYGSGRGMFVMEVASSCVGAVHGADALERKNEIGRCIQMGARPGETGPAAIAPYPIANQTPYEEALRVTAEWYRQALARMD